MSKKTRLKRILGNLGKTDDASGLFKVLDTELKRTSASIKEAIEIKTVEESQKKFEDIRMAFEGILSAIQGLRDGVEERDGELQSMFNTRVSGLTKDVNSTESKFEKGSKVLANNLSKVERDLQGKIREVSERKIIFPDVTPDLNALERRVVAMIQSLPKGLQESDLTDTKEKLEKLEDDVEALRTRALSFLSRGGSMNRKENFNGVDYLTKYTDINWKAGNNVLFTVVNNDVTKMVDVTISSSGSGGGITRVITSVAVDTVAGDAADTDYVYLVSGTTTITLPTAVGNDNLYTVKNVGVGVVTIDTTGAETIDDDTNVIMPLQYTSVDLISNSTDWKIT